MSCWSCGTRPSAAREEPSHWSELLLDPTDAWPCGRHHCLARACHAEPDLPTQRRLRLGGLRLGGLMLAEEPSVFRRRKHGQH
jgi:hypothetical protein